MKIHHKIDDFLLESFPQYKKTGNDLAILKEEIAKYFILGPYQPNVSISGELITIEINSPAILYQEADNRKATSLCEKVE